MKSSEPGAYAKLTEGGPPRRGQDPTEIDVASEKKIVDASYNQTPQVML